MREAAAPTFGAAFSGGQRFEELPRPALSLATPRSPRSGARHRAGAKQVPGREGDAFYIYEELLTWWKRACPVWVSIDAPPHSPRHGTHPPCPLHLSGDCGEQRFRAQQHRRQAPQVSRRRRLCAARGGDSLPGGAARAPAPHARPQRSAPLRRPRLPRPIGPRRVRQRHCQRGRATTPLTTCNRLKSACNPTHVAPSLQSCVPGGRAGPLPARFLMVPPLARIRPHVTQHRLPGRLTPALTTALTPALTPALIPTPTSTPAPTLVLTDKQAAAAMRKLGAQLTRRLCYATQV